MKTPRTMLAAVAVCAWIAAGGAQTPASSAAHETVQSPELERFLKTAPITAFKKLGSGVTQSRKATLELDGVTHFAVFKIVDEKPVMGVQKLEGGVEAEFQDSWRTEVAAYELDKLIGLNQVPTTVERKYDKENVEGSLQFWVDNIMDEKKRQATKTDPPNVTEWNDEMSKLVMWDNLIYNTDRNLNNILVTPTWKLVAIDHSRTFRPFAQLKDTKSMTRFSRSLLARMAALNESKLKKVLDPYLTQYQIQGILKRRDAIAAIAKKLVAEKGEAAVLFQ
jgi:hypothetical protein